MDLAKRAAAADLLHEFCWLADNGGGASIAALFVDEGTVITPHFELAGRAEIHAWFSERARPGARIARHLATNLRFEERDGDRLAVTGYSLVTVQSAQGEEARVMIGTTTDEILFAAGKPLFLARRLEVALQGRLAIEEPAA